MPYRAAATLGPTPSLGLAVHKYAWRVCLQELVLDVEYLLAVLSPKTEHELPHDDWCGTF